MNLTLNRPIVFFDLETTGTDIVRDRVVELSYLKIFPDGTEQSHTYRINPLIPIPLEASQVHGIYDNDVKDCPCFRQIAPEIAGIFEGADVGGFNSNRFDLPLLAEEMIRSGLDFDPSAHRFVDVQVIYHKMEQRTLSAAYKFYCGKDLVDAHSALGDTRATYEVLQAQLDRYGELRNDVDFLSSYTSHSHIVDFAGRMVLDERGDVVFNFGKHKGKKVTDVLRAEPGYYSWMMNSDFALHTKSMLRKIKESMQN